MTTFWPEPADRFDRVVAGGHGRHHRAHERHLVHESGPPVQVTVRAGGTGVGVGLHDRVEGLGVQLVDERGEERSHRDQLR